MRVFCELPNGLNLGGGMLLAHGVNSVADEAWAEWSAKMAASSLIADRVVWALPDEAEPAVEAVTELPSPAPSALPQEGDQVNPVAPVGPAVDSLDPAAVVAEPGQPEEMPNE